MTSETQLLWSEFGHRLRGFIARRVDNEADAEDILQDVFLRIHQRAGSVNRADRLTSWLFQVTRNAIADHYRAAARRDLPIGDAAEAALDRPADDGLAAVDDLAAATASRELAGCLRPLVERLPPRYREAVALVDLAGQTHMQAAARLGLSVPGTKSRVQRGRRALRDLLVECCPVELDAGGRIVDYEPRDLSCALDGGRRDEVGRTGDVDGCACSPRGAPNPGSPPAA